MFVNTEPVANLVDATWLSLPASSSGRSSFPLYIVSVSSEPSLAKTLVQSLGRNLNFSNRGAKIRLRLAGLLVIQNYTPLLVEHFDGQFGHAYHPNRGGVRLRIEEITHLLPFITAVLLCNADTIGLERLQSRRKLRLRHVVRGPTRPHGIISFFDGSGSFANTLAKELGPPCAMLIAELDSSIRTVISAVQGYHLDPAIWTYANHRIPVRYLADVWEIVHHHFAALKEFLALLPEDALIIFGAGSPCQDNTKIGRGCGKLGITGSRSVHYHVVYILQEMANCFKQYIQDTCGVPSSCIHRINTTEWSAVSRNRYFFVSNSSYIVPSQQTDPWQQGWMLPKPRHKPVSPLPTWLRTRGITPGGHIRFTTSAYHPRHLLYKIDYFGTVADFHEKCDEQGWPDLPWLTFCLPPLSEPYSKSFSGGHPLHSPRTKSRKQQPPSWPNTSTIRA